MGYGELCGGLSMVNSGDRTLLLATQGEVWIGMVCCGGPWNLSEGLSQSGGKPKNERWDASVEGSWESLH